MSNELEKSTVIRNYRTTASDAKNYDALHYNLNMIIALGFKVRSNIGTKFRIWADDKLKRVRRRYKALHVKVFSS